MGLAINTHRQARVRQMSQPAGEEQFSAGAEHTGARLPGLVEKGGPEPGKTGTRASGDDEIGFINGR